MDKVTKLQRQLQHLFVQGGLLLHKWNSSNPSALRHIPAELRDSQCKHAVPDPSEHARTFGIEWNAITDRFRLIVATLPPIEESPNIFLCRISQKLDVPWLVLTGYH